MSRVLLAALAVVVTSGLTAQSHDHCRDQHNWRDRDDEQVCDVREYTLNNLRDLVLDGGQNGGITVEAWDRPDILVEAIVVTRARSMERASEMAEQVEVSANSQRISARGPNGWQRGESWWVSWHVRAPAGTNLDLETMNGGIRITGMAGRTRFDAMNGGVTLADMAGDVSGSTVNGGLRIDLAGTSWTGAGLDVQATNGGVRMTVPEGYSGMFETGTVNGRMEVDFPVTVQGRFGGRSLNFTLGNGGPTVRARTTNGGVHIIRT